MTTNIFNMADTWNNVATTFTAIKMNVTDTASQAASLLMDLQVGGASSFSVQKSGLTTIKSNSGSNVIIGGNYNGFSVGSCSVGYHPNEVLGYTFAFTGTSIDGADTYLQRDAIGIVAQRNGVNAQIKRVYNTFTDASNGEWMGFDWQATANVARIRMVANGTGTARPIAIDSYQKAGAAVAADIPVSTWALVRDTVGATTKLVYNNAGTLMTVALA